MLIATTLTTRFYPLVLRGLRKVEHAVDRIGPAAAAVIVLLFGLWAWFAAHESRLSMEELLEISVATAPTQHDILSSLAAGIDYNPPLSHELVRASVSLLGTTEFAIRLPSFVGMASLLIFLYLFVSRWLSPSYGIFAMLIIICSPVRDFAVLGRPYALVLGLSALALLLYQRLMNQGARIPNLAGLALCTACLAASHYYAVLVVGALLFAEAFRIWESRSVDWPLLACAIAPPVAVFAFLLNVIRGQRQQLSHYFARGNLLSFDHGYDSVAVDPLVYCVALLLIVCVLFLYRRGDFSPELHVPVNISPPEILLGIGLLLLPIFGAVCTQFVTHAYVTRYFLPVVIGLSICVCFAARLFSSILRGVVVLLILSLLLGFGKAIFQDAHRPTEPLPEESSLTGSTSPILFDSPSLYMQTVHYFPHMRDKLWVIADPPAQLHYRNYDTDDKIMLALESKGLTQTTTLRSAAHRWSHFSLIPRTGDYVWALKCVIDAGAEIKVRRAFTDSNFVFDVTVPDSSLPRIDACGADPKGF